jgi:hypothetical protein
MSAGAFVNSLYTVVYVSRQFTTGLTDVELYVLRPDNVKEGPFVMTEIDALSTETQGLYKYDYLPLQEGEYTFIADSATAPKRDAKVVTFQFETGRRPVLKFD